MILKVFNIQKVHKKLYEKQFNNDFGAIIDKDLSYFRYYYRTKEQFFKTY